MARPTKPSKSQKPKPAKRPKPAKKSVKQSATAAAVKKPSKAKHQPKAGLHSTKRWYLIVPARTARRQFVVAGIASILALVLVLGFTPHHAATRISHHDSHPTIISAAAKQHASAVAKAATTLAALGDKTSCPHGRILTTVAHQDDDILFMNPSLQQAIANGQCLRTVYLTAGDDGKDASYWQQREQGSQAAYATMFGTDDAWTPQTPQIAGHAVTTYSLNGNPRVSLVFLRLPDGGVNGSGFASTGFQSLHALQINKISTINSVDGASDYTKIQLINTLQTIINLDQPAVINTQAFSPALALGDHSDHQTTGLLTTIAAATAKHQVQMHRYVGYQTRSMAPNLTDDQIAGKLNVFSAYESRDEMICNGQDCFNSFVYQDFLSRQYEQSATAP